MTDALGAPDPASQEAALPPDRALARFAQSRGIDDKSLDGLIKLRSRDFERIPDAPLILHLNAVPCTIKSGGRYVAMRIAQPGEPGRPPLMDWQSGALWVCILSAERDFDELQDSILPLTVGLPRTMAELAEIMDWRYAGLRSSWRAGGVAQLSSFRRAA